MKTKPSTFTALALLLIIIAAFYYGCKKDDSLPWPLSELPPATQTGENTFGCLINGEPFVPGIYVWDPTAHELEVSYDEPNYGWDDNNRFSIRAEYSHDTTWTVLSFGLYPLLAEGEYWYNLPDFFSCSGGIKKSGEFKSYYLDRFLPHNITITHLDTAQNIVSGTFEMDMRRVSDSTDIIQIRHGRFDVRYFPE